MLDSLITSKTRLQLVLHFFLNPDNSSYLRRLAEEFGESTNAIRVELNRLEESKLLTSKFNGRKKWYAANKSHPLFPELNSIVKKVIGLDKLIDEVLNNLGELEKAFIIGDYARGIDSGIVELVIVGNVDHEYLNVLVKKAETLIKRSVKTLVLNYLEYQQFLLNMENSKCLLIWGKNDLDNIFAEEIGDN